VEPDHDPANLEFSAASMQAMGDAVLRRVVAHLATIGEQPVRGDVDAAELCRAMREPAPEHGSVLEPLLDVLFDEWIPRTYNTASPGYLAFIPSGGVFPAALADLLSGAVNRYTGVWRAAPALVQLESNALEWLRDWMQFPASTRGVFATGGSTANLTAIVCARERALGADIRPGVMYASDQVHHSVLKSARLAGVMPDRIRAIPVDDAFRMRVDALEDAIQRDAAAGLRPFLVVSSAGTTNTGAVDPLPAIAEVCEREKLFLHVDASFGWAACLTEDGRRLLAGIERADSITFDPHKWLAQTFEVGGLLVRRGELERAFALRPEYMQDVEPADGEVNFADRGIALSRRFRALKVWLSVKVLGLGWFARLVDHGRALARYAEQKLLESDFEVMSGEQLAIVCFRHVVPGLNDEEQDRHNRVLIDAVRASGEAFLSSTRLHGRFAIRFCLINWRTSADDVDRVVAVLRRLASSASRIEGR
jgi:aromatic-L-amino-acid/L-tryptophan decarboxylase